MPELPEVEVSRLGITPHLAQQTVKKLVVRQPQLRWRIPDEIYAIEGERIEAIERRAKYLLLRTSKGDAIVHLGMSGSLRVLPANTPEEKHDHVDLVLNNGKLLRYNDPRRFGAWLWQEKGEVHESLSHLGPEPLDDAFHADYLFERAKGKRVSIKVFIMTNQHVVGVGNIYANEALFMAGIDPRRAAGHLSCEEMKALVARIKEVLAQAIEQGGTTLKDFQQADGKPGYFAQELRVYGKKGQPCPACGETLEEVKLGQRATTYCPQCQQ
ncbi:bifunctional DNA-formamidopyrimidine glycosylase/DNA-(apurinic or apyrimidinic site) lyase [Thaumasiovibrio subtropicus]|uniref:bifunctional DNA-formamidopyrimidine glycosylase/DNA-(apurinic or apyrimidinic site) lyase n=1 Tax=Thaumasiovibrio subtropicus TaxID=1891207 RepID=UPI000B34AA50|nr:bifunctional DNA-formamidopyrimidine glycosylase/DNA-(apurinic or apyrimidinic site) lyase [Thaumasiovibrio subtropicus]